MSYIFNGNETPEQREARKNKAVMGALQAGAMQQPKDVGQGIAALGDAFAYRAMANRQAQAAADPWNGMRQAGAPGLFGRIGSFFRG